MKGPRLTASCFCGNVEIEAVGRPITAVVCYCNDCQAAAAQIEAMPGAASFRDGDGGTSLIVFQKDRVRCVRGASLLMKVKLRDVSPTNRHLAKCCNSVMVLDFDDNKHWADIYSTRVVGIAPKPEMLVCTKFAPDRLANADHTPAYPGYPIRFWIKLLMARVAMLCSK